MRARLSPDDPPRHRLRARSTGRAAATINDLTNPALDPASRMPEFKTCAVALEAAESTTGEDADT